MSERIRLSIGTAVALGAAVFMGHAGAVLDLPPTLQYMLAAMGAGWTIWLYSAREVARIRRDTAESEAA